MTALDFYSYKLGLIQKISEASTMNDVRAAFDFVPVETEGAGPCQWTTEELQEKLLLSDNDFQNGRYKTGREAINHFKRYCYGGKVV